MHAVVHLQRERYIGVRNVNDGPRQMPYLARYDEDAPARLN